MRRLYFYLILIPLFLIPGLLVAEVNLVENSGFEEDYLGNLTIWDMDAFITNQDAVRISATNEVSYSGERSLIIVNLVPNDAKAIQWVKVEPETYYRISCWIMAIGVSDQGIGANISVLGNIAGPEDVKNTNGEWRYIELIGKTGPAQEVLPVTVRLGFYGHLSTGRAYFDDVMVTPLDEVPAGKIMDFSSPMGVGEIEPEEEKTELWEDVFAWLQKPPLILLGVLIFLFLANVFLVLYVLLLKNKMKKAALKTSPAVQVPLDSKQAKRTLKLIEKREVHRKNKKIKVIVKKISKKGGYVYIEVMSVNISVQGIFIEIEDTSLLNIGEEVLLEVKQKRKTYDMGKAVVLHKQDAFDKEGEHCSGGIGFMFTSKDKKHINNIKLIVGK